MKTIKKEATKIYMSLLNPRSFLFKVVFSFTIAIWIYHFLGLDEVQNFPFTISFIISSLLATLLIACTLIPWYGNEHRGLGIEAHFRNILLPTTYLLFAQNLLMLGKIQLTSLNIIIGFIFMGLMFSNGVLLHYHFRDKDKTPPSYFASNTYLKRP